MDAGEAFGPCSAKEFAEDGFGLVIESVGGGDGIERVLGHEAAEPGVAEAAGGFFDGLVGLVGVLCGFRFGVDLMGVERQAERGGEIGAELLVNVGFGATEAVVEMGDVEDDAEVGGAGGEGAGEGDRVCSAGEADGEAEAGG
jgi:hypothetical protein